MYDMDFVRRSKQEAETVEDRAIKQTHLESAQNFSGNLASYTCEKVRDYEPAASKKIDLGAGCLKAPLTLHRWFEAHTCIRACMSTQPRQYLP